MIKLNNKKMKKAEKNKTEKPDVEQLLKQMEEIATALLTISYITDFTIHDTNFVLRTNGKTPFAWMIYNSGTHIYALDNEKEIQRFLELLEHFENHSNLEFCLYRYDSTKLFPVFHSVIKEWIRNANIKC